MEYKNYLITVSEMADLLRTTNKAIYTMTERGLLPGAVRIGKRLLFKREEMLRFIDRCTLSSEGVGDEYSC